MLKVKDINVYYGKIHALKNVSFEVRPGEVVALIGAIIRLSQLDEGDPLPWERVDVSALCRDIAADLRDKSEKSGTAITVEGPEIPVEGVRRLLYETVYNLCDNAIQYNVPGGSVAVTVTANEDNAVITVSDTGIGIPADQQSRGGRGTIFPLQFCQRRRFAPLEGLKLRGAHVGHVHFRRVIILRCYNG